MVTSWQLQTVIDIAVTIHDIGRLCKNHPTSSLRNVEISFSFQIATQMVWTGLTALGEIMASLSVMFFMLRRRVRTTEKVLPRWCNVADDFRYTEDVYLSPQNQCLEWDPNRMYWMQIATNESSYASVRFTESEEETLLIHCLALYPLASCFVNLLSIFSALHSSITGGIHSQTVSCSYTKKDQFAA